MPPKPGRSLRVVGAVLAASLTFISTGALGTSRAAPSASELDAAETKLLDLQSEISSVTNQYNDARTKLESIQTDIIQTEKTVRQLAKRMLGQQENAVELAQEIYKGGTTGGIEAVLSSKTLADIDAQLAYLQSSEESRNEVFERLAADRSQLEEQLDEMDAARAEAAETESYLVGLKEEIETNLAAQQDEIADIESAVAAADAREAAAAADAAAAAEAAADEAEDVASEPPPPTGVPAPAPPSGGYSANWDAIAQCESGGNWQINSTYDGGLQFHPDTWLAYGGGQYARYAYQASREQQIAIAEKVLAGQGPGAWPNCFVYN